MEGEAEDEDEEQFSEEGMNKKAGGATHSSSPAVESDHSTRSLAHFLWCSLKHLEWSAILCEWALRANPEIIRVCTSTIDKVIEVEIRDS